MSGPESRARLHWVTGIPAMIQVLRTADMGPPRFEEGVSTFCVTFLRHSLLAQESFRPYCIVPSFLRAARSLRLRIHAPSFAREA